MQWLRIETEKKYELIVEVLGPYQTHAEAVYLLKYLCYLSPTMRRVRMSRVLSFLPVDLLDFFLSPTLV